MRPGKPHSKLCLTVFGLFCLYATTSGRGAEYLHVTQDLLEAGRRTDSLDSLALARYLSLSGRLPPDGTHGIDLFLSGKFFYGFPVLSGHGIIRSDLFRFQGSLLFALRLSENLLTCPLDLYLGAHGVRYGLSTPVCLPLPAGDPLGNGITVSDYVSDQFFDDLVELRLVASGFGMLRAGWVQNEIYAATVDGRVERDRNHRVSRTVLWVFEIEALSLLRFDYRMDSATRIDSWRVSTGILDTLVRWFASSHEEGFLKFLVQAKRTPETVRKEMIAQGLPWFEFGLRAENHFRDSHANLRGSNDPNLVWEFEAGKRFFLGSGSWLQLDTSLGLFSRSWARWHAGRRLRELSLGLEFVVDLGLALRPDSPLDVFVNRQALQENSIRMAYFIRYGTFTDAGLALFDPKKGMTVSGYRIGTRISLWDSAEVELSYAENDPADLKRFSESVGRGVFMFHLGYRY